MDFDRIAPHYHWIERLCAGHKVQRCRTAFLGRVRGAKNALVVGDGDGRFLAELLRTNPLARVTCIDASCRMLELARRRVKHLGLEQGRLRFVRADALAWSPPDKPFDLLVTHFFFDNFRADEVASLVEKLAGCAAADARWLIADFHEPSSGVARVRARLILRVLYTAFRVIAGVQADVLTDPDPILRRNGFELIERRRDDFGFLQSDVWVRACPATRFTP